MGIYMIELTKLNYEKYYMNCDLIEIIEQVPDTLITMTTGKKYYALETPEEIIKKIKEFKKSIIENCSMQKRHRSTPQQLPEEK
jgi:flagellar protein FlbD